MSPMGVFDQKVSLLKEAIDVEMLMLLSEENEVNPILKSEPKSEQMVTFGDHVLSDDSENVNNRYALIRARTYRSALMGGVQ